MSITATKGSIQPVVAPQIKLEAGTSISFHSYPAGSGAVGQFIFSRKRNADGTLKHLAIVPLPNDNTKNVFVFRTVSGAPKS